MASLELVCPLCANKEFREEQGRLPAGFGHHRMTLMVCTQCNLVLHFYKKRSMS
jgi:predicted nucleic-acid-binding Zn-ribbon protein